MPSKRHHSLQTHKSTSWCQALLRGEVQHAALQISRARMDICTLLEEPQTTYESLEGIFQSALVFDCGSKALRDQEPKTLKKVPRGR